MAHCSLASGEYRTRWEPVYRQIFSGNRVGDGPFKDSTWRMVLLPGMLRLDRQDLESLKTAALELHDQAFVIVDGEGDYPDEPPVVLTWDLEAYCAFCPNSVFSHVVAHSFGLSGQWGRVSSHEGFNLIGGSACFLDRFVEISGGLPLLQERFFEAVRDGEIGWGPQGLVYARTLLRLVGWDRVENDLNG